MVDYGKVLSREQPQEVTITASSVFVASDIQPFTKEIEGYIEEGYEYNLKEYSTSEYLLHQDEKMSSLEEELKAAKILLGVD